MARGVDERRFASVVREVGDRTPADRNRVVDLVRVAALSLVVLGHWLKQGLYVDDAGTLHRSGLLAQAEWTHPFTWIFQVMPLIFAVGGFANALSWRGALARRETYGSWLRHRTRRLTAPLLPLLTLWAVAPVLARLAGLGDDWLHVASKTSLVATWFLATYVVVVAVVPFTHALWRRWGWASIILGGALAALFDLLSLGEGLIPLGYLNVLVVWGTLHQCGYAWLDRRPTRRVGKELLALVLLLTVLILLVWWGPYGVSMVGVDGHGVNNTAPPRLTILVLGCAQLAGVLVLEPWLRRLVQVRVVWAVVVLIELRAMTLYLWHLTALSLLAAVALRAGGWGLHPHPSTGEWWLLRPGWFVALGVTTAMLVWLCGRFEDVSNDRGAARGAGSPIAEIVVVVVSLALLGLYGVGSQSGGTGGAVAGLCVVVLLGVRWWDRRTQRPFSRH